MPKKLIVFLSIVFFAMNPTLKVDGTQSPQALSPQDILEKRLRGLLDRRLYLTASQELIGFMQWHPHESSSLTSWFQKIDDMEKAALTESKADLLERSYAEVYENFFNGSSEIAIKTGKKLIEVAGKDAAWLERIREVEDVIKPLEAQWDGRRGLEAYRHDRLEEAQMWFEKSLSQRSDDELKRLLGEIKARRAGERKAEQEKRKLREVQELLFRGRLYFERGDNRNGELEFMKIQEIHPGDLEAGRYLNLIREASKSVIDADRAKDYYKEGSRAYRLGQLLEAQGLWQTALRFDPFLEEAKTSLRELSQKLVSDRREGRPGEK